MATCLVTARAATARGSLLSYLVTIKNEVFHLLVSIPSVRFRLKFVCWVIKFETLLVLKLSCVVRCGRTIAVWLINTWTFTATILILIQTSPLRSWSFVTARLVFELLLYAVHWHIRELFGTCDQWLGKFPGVRGNSLIQLESQGLRKVFLPFSWQCEWVILILRHYCVGYRVNCFLNWAFFRF